MVEEGGGVEEGDVRRPQPALALGPVLALRGGLRLALVHWLRCRPGRHVEGVDAERAQQAGVPLDGVRPAEQGVEVAGDDGPQGLADGGVLGPMRVGDEQALLRVLGVVQLGYTGPVALEALGAQENGLRGHLERHGGVPRAVLRADFIQLCAGREPRDLPNPGGCGVAALRRAKECRVAGHGAGDARLRGQALETGLMIRARVVPPGQRGLCQQNFALLEAAGRHEAPATARGVGHLQAPLPKGSRL